MFNVTVTAKLSTHAKINYTELYLMDLLSLGLMHVKKFISFCQVLKKEWLSSRVVNVLDSGTVWPGFKSQSRHCWVTVLGKLFTPIVPLFTKQQNW